MDPRAEGLVFSWLQHLPHHHGGVHRGLQFPSARRAQTFPVGAAPALGGLPEPTAPAQTPGTSQALLLEGVSQHSLSWGHPEMGRGFPGLPTLYVGTQQARPRCKRSPDSPNNWEAKPEFPALPVPWVPPSGGGGGGHKLGVQRPL